MPFNQYVSLSQSDDFTKEGMTGTKKGRVSRCSPGAAVLFLTLLISLGCNLIAYTRLPRLPVCNQCATTVVGLTRNVPGKIEYHTPFNDPERAKENAAWASELVNPEMFVVALNDTFTESKGVLHSIRWPWDSNKGVYSMNSAHELHCLHLIRTTVNQAYDDLPLTWPRQHTNHCLAYLLQSVMCNADDTLLYQGILHDNIHADHRLGGLGVTRQCRDWDKMQAWAKEHSACYRVMHEKGGHDVPEVEKYKYCPDGSKPWESL